MSELDCILGNEIIKNHFKAAIRNQKISHAYIIEGERGSGKKLLAATFSKILQCENQKEDACGKCSSCLQMEKKDHPDVIWVTHEKPNVVSVGEIRSQVINTIDVKPYKGPYKIYIIDDAEKLNDAAQNAILKTIEEPPEYALIFLLTKNKGIFLPTILSRCIQFTVKPIKSSMIKHYLMNRYTMEEERAEFYASYSMGNIGKAIEAFSSEDFNSMKDELIALLREIQKQSIYEIYDKLKDIKKQKQFFSEIFDIMTIWFHDTLIIKSSSSMQGIIFKEEELFLEAQSKYLSYESINEIINRIMEARLQIQSNVIADGTFDSLFIDIRNKYKMND